MAVRANAVGL